LHAASIGSFKPPECDADDPSTHSARQEMLKIISAYVPTLAKLERWELSATCHVLNFFAAAFEEFCHIGHVERLCLP
jgi:hypothetical protein